MNLLKKKSSLLSPQAAKIVAVSVVTLAAVGAIVIIAHQAEPKASAAPSVKAAAASQPAPETSSAKNTTSVKGKAAKGATTANGKGVVQAEIVTITGCLEEKNDGFRLKDTSGTDAPRSRSWKTLGMTKHNSSVAVVDATKKLKLGSHVGERVSVTGALLDKEIQLKSMKALSPSCD